MANIDEKLERIEGLADDIESGRLQTQDQQFLVGALRKIAQGEDPLNALDIRAGRGERRSKISRDSQKKTRITRQLIMGWIAAAKASEEQGGLGLTLEQTIELFEQTGLSNMGLCSDTVRTYWNNSPSLRQLEFTLSGELKS